MSAQQMLRDENFKFLSLCVQLVRMDYTEVIIDQRFHRHLIGKNGANSE